MSQLKQTRTHVDHFSSFLTSFAMKTVSEFMGKKITLIIGAVVGLIGCIWVQFGCSLDDPKVKYYIFFVAIIIGKSAD